MLFDEIHIQLQILKGTNVRLRSATHRERSLTGEMNPSGTNVGYAHNPIYDQASRAQPSG